MRYVKGGISLSPSHDYPLLRQVLHSGFVTHRQLFEFMWLGCQARERPASEERLRWSFNWRIRRLVAHGLVHRHVVRSVAKDFVYSITAAGALQLVHVGERFVATAARATEDGRELQVAHAIELNSIQLSLLRAGLLVRWVSEIEIQSRNAVREFAYAKDYDAIATVRLEDGHATFALECERTAKSAADYLKIVEKIEMEGNVDRFLYLTSSADVLRFVSWHFRDSSRLVCFGLLTEWYERMLDTEVFDWSCREYRPLRAALGGGSASRVAGHGPQRLLVDSSLPTL